MVIWKLPAEVSSWVTALIQVLHRRLTWRLVRLLVGLLFDQGRETVYQLDPCRRHRRRKRA